MQRGTHKNNKIGKQLPDLKKSILNKKFDFVLLEKALVSICKLHLDNLIPFHKKATQVENVVLKKAIFVHMSIIISYLLLGE